MRSTLVRTGVLVDENGLPRIELKPDDILLTNMLDNIVDFLLTARETGKASFAELYQKLTAPAYHIGMRKGLIPIYLAAVFHEYKQEIIIQDRFGQVPLNADTLIQLNSTPDMFELTFLDWNPE